MSKVRIEILYPEFNHLYGDTGNIRYLCKKLQDAGVEAEIVETHLRDRPAFTREKVDLLYVGPCTERQQQLEIEALQPWKEALAERIESGGVTLMTGNAFEMLGQFIRCCDGSEVPALGLLPVFAERFSRLRYNDLCVGSWDGLDIVGFKNQLSHSYLLPDGDIHAFLQMEKGCGLNPISRTEGFQKNQFFATYLIGPILPLNPQFADRLLGWLAPEVESFSRLPFEQEAYEHRLIEFRRK